VSLRRVPAPSGPNSIVASETAAFGHDVVVVRVEFGHHAALPLALEALAPADAEVHLAHQRLPLARGCGEPLSLRRGIGPGGEYAPGRLGEAALDRETRVLRGAIFRRVFHGLTPLPER